MKSSFTGFLAALTPLAAGLLLAACCCETSSRCCDPCSGGGAGAVGGVPRDRIESELRPSTVFQRLVVTNKHTKPVTVTPIGYMTDGNGVRVPIPFRTELSLNPTPNVVEPGQQQTFIAIEQGVTSIDVTYQELSDPSPYVESIVTTINPTHRCIMGYDPAPMDTYLIADMCPLDPPN